MDMDEYSHSLLYFQSFIFVGSAEGDVEKRMINNCSSSLFFCSNKVFK